MANASYFTFFYQNPPYSNSPPILLPLDKLFLSSQLITGFATMILIGSFVHQHNENTTLDSLYSIKEKSVQGENFTPIFPVLIGAFLGFAGLGLSCYVLIKKRRIVLDTNQNP